VRKHGILCVDDEKIILQSLRKQLARNFGDRYRYEIAESPEEALEVIEELVADSIEVLVIVSDWLMPNMRGDEFLILVHQKFPNITKIMLTGQADETAIDRAKEYANLYCCISKPWDEAYLVDRVGMALGVAKLDD
jgi:CheY-like chemotaxis protein